VAVDLGIHFLLTKNTIYTINETMKMKQVFSYLHFAEVRHGDDLKTELEKMLSIFDQSKISSNHHILNIKEEEYPEKYHPIIRRLQHAAAESVVRDQMDIEDEITDELNNMSRVIEQQKEILIEAEVALEKSKAALEEKDKALEEKEKQIRELLKRLESTS
jgi:hypothetical protein